MEKEKQDSIKRAVPEGKPKVELKAKPKISSEAKPNVKPNATPEGKTRVRPKEISKETPPVIPNFRSQKRDTENGRRITGKRSGLELEILRFRRKVLELLETPASAILLCAAAVLLIVGLVLFYRTFKVYRDYTVFETSQKEETSGAVYLKVNNRLVHYSPDGIKSEDMNSQDHWNISFDLNNPVADVSGDSICVADLKGSLVYLFNAEGEMGSFTAAQTISKVRVSDCGMTAVVQKENNINWIDLHKPDGSVVVRVKSTLEDTGYPIDLDVSPDGTQMVVSYLRIDKGEMKTDLVFYNFGDYGQMKTNNIVKRETFRGTVIPDVEYLSDSRVLVLRENGYSIYEGERKITEDVKMEFPEGTNILSVCENGNTIAFVTEESRTVTEKKDGQTISNDIMVKMLNLYKLNTGKRVKRVELNISYNDITMESGKIMFYDDNHLWVYNTSGKLVFDGETKEQISYVMKLEKEKEYLLISPSSINWIRIR